MASNGNDLTKQKPQPNRNKDLSRYAQTRQFMPAQRLQKDIH